MILDFIRSRPPLMPYKQRQNVRFLEKKDSMSLFDKLLHDIRSSDHLKRLKHIECKSEGATPIKRFNQSVQQHNGKKNFKFLKSQFVIVLRTIGSLFLQFCVLCFVFSFLFLIFVLGFLISFLLCLLRFAFMSIYQIIEL